MSEAREVSPEKLKKIKELFDDLPVTYPEIKWQLGAIQHAFRSEFAQHLEPHINRFLQESLPLQKTDRNRLALSAEVDGGLANLGVCAHVNGEPALLAVEATGPGNTEKSKYSIVVRANNPMGFRRIATSNKVPSLKLMAGEENNDSYMKPLRDFVYHGKLKGRTR